jgi:hypothetical protein
MASADRDAQEVADVRAAPVAAHRARQVGRSQGDLNKDISLTSPLSSGLVPYDLEAPVQEALPGAVAVRNRTSRVKGQGQTRRIKRITGISNSGTGGVARLSPFMADGTTDTFAGLTMQRPKKISYAGDDVTFNYKQRACRTPSPGRPSSPARASRTAPAVADVDPDGVDDGRGARPHRRPRHRRRRLPRRAGAPTFANFTLTARTAGAGETGNSANIANIYLKVTVEGIFGESAASAASAANTILSAATGKVVDVTITAGSIPAGATGFRYYLSIDNATWYYYGRSAIWGGTSALASAAYTFNFTGGGTGGAIVTGTTAPASDTTRARTPTTVCSPCSSTRPAPVRSTT